MSNKISLLMVGGDERQKYTARKLKEFNYDVLNINDCLSSDSPCHCKDNIFTEMFEQSDGIILPLPVTRDRVTINLNNNHCLKVQQLTDLLNKNQIVFGGMFTTELMSIISEKCKKIVDYYNNDEVIIKNTIPTAQGVLKIVLDNITKTLPELSVLITGYGKTAKPLARWFTLLGSHVCAAARSTASQAEISINNAKAISFTEPSSSIEAYDVVINTVPSLVLTDEVIADMKPEAFIVDIASRPYGTDFDAAEKRGVKVIVPGSLPGKAAPETAGYIIAQAIHDYFGGDSIV